MFIAGLAPGTVSEHSLFTFGVCCCNKFLNYSLLWMCTFKTPMNTLHQNVPLNSYLVGISIIDDLCINNSHIHQSEKQGDRPVSAVFWQVTNCWHLIHTTSATFCYTIKCVLLLSAWLIHEFLHQHALMIIERQNPFSSLARLKLMLHPSQNQTCLNTIITCTEQTI